MQITATSGCHLSLPQVHSHLWAHIMLTYSSRVQGACPPTSAPHFCNACAIQQQQRKPAAAWPACLSDPTQLQHLRRTASHCHRPRACVAAMLRIRCRIHQSTSSRRSQSGWRRRRQRAAAAPQGAASKPNRSCAGWPDRAVAARSCIMLPRQLAATATAARRPSGALAPSPS